MSLPNPTDLIATLPLLLWNPQSGDIDIDSPSIEPYSVENFMQGKCPWEVQNLDKINMLVFQCLEHDISTSDNFIQCEIAQEMSNYSKLVATRAYLCYMPLEK